MEKFDTTKLAEHRYVAMNRDGHVLGCVAVAPVSDRCAYAGVVEHSVYVHPDARGRGIGHALLRSTNTAGTWTVQAGIFPENTASLTMHTKSRIRTIGTRERIGRHHGR
ncbi:GNAT family N-acetyltransferase [Nocardia jiangxiensis]|uniref:GNAT family N-acetyltransferase n=1 Tax=Nocardia jiangxiensis TaxID=282685 RepID=A0ABW6S7J2_9NOCA